VSVRANAGLVDQIRNDLLSARYSPSERLVESELAARYAAPRAAVHIALIALANEGLVERQPNRGAAVRSFTLEEAIEVAETRRELEALVARHAAAVASTRERGELLGLVEAMRIATQRAEVQDYRDLSVRFHERIGEVSGHATARRFLMEMRNHKLELHFPEAFAESRGTASSFAEHEAIGRAVAAGDTTGAERAMRRHVGSVVALLEEYRASLALSVNQNVDDLADV
jgi:DNA-binding GntR family transcriptional regulator